MRFAGRIAPGSGAGPFTGHKLAASALSTTKPLRPPVHVFRAGFAAAVVDFVVPDLAVPDFAVAGLDDGLPDGFTDLPNESARVVGCALFAVGWAWPARGAAMIADAMRQMTFDCTALARRKGDAIVRAGSPAVAFAGSA